MNRKEILLNNALSWVYDHCLDNDDYISALKWIGMNDKEIKKELENCDIDVPTIFQRFDRVVFNKRAKNLIEHNKLDEFCCVPIDVLEKVKNETFVLELIHNAHSVCAYNKKYNITMWLPSDLFELD